jgi:hypothetical protein
MGRNFELGQACSYSRGEFSREMSSDPAGGEGVHKEKSKLFYCIFCVRQKKGWQRDDVVMSSLRLSANG